MESHRDPEHLSWLHTKPYSGVQWDLPGTWDCSVLSTTVCSHGRVLYLFLRCLSLQTWTTEGGMSSPVSRSIEKMHVTCDCLTPRRRHAFSDAHLSFSRRSLAEGELAHPSQRCQCALPANDAATGPSPQSSPTAVTLSAVPRGASSFGAKPTPAWFLQAWLPSAQQGPFVIYWDYWPYFFSPYGWKYALLEDLREGVGDTQHSVKLWCGTAGQLASLHLSIAIDVGTVFSILQFISDVSDTKWNISVSFITL